MRQVAELKTLKAGTLDIAAHESAAVYLLPAPLRHYLSAFPTSRSASIAAGSTRSPGR